MTKPGLPSIEKTYQHPSIPSNTLKTWRLSIMLILARVILHQVTSKIVIWAPTIQFQASMRSTQQIVVLKISRSGTHMIVTTTITLWLITTWYTTPTQVKQLFSNYFLFPDLSWANNASYMWTWYINKIIVFQVHKLLSTFQSALHLNIGMWIDYALCDVQESQEYFKFRHAQRNSGTPCYVLQFLVQYRRLSHCTQCKECQSCRTHNDSV